MAQICRATAPRNLVYTKTVASQSRLPGQKVINQPKLDELDSLF